MLWYKVHVSHLGWIGPLKNGEIAIFPDEQIEAIIVGANQEMNIFVLENEQWVDDSEGFAGTVGQGRSINAFRIDIGNGCSIFYRGFFEKSGWSELCKKNQVCSDDKFHSRLEGIQIFSTEDSTYNLAINHAEKEYSRCIMYFNNMYVSNIKELLPSASRDYYDPSPCRIRIVEYGVILPLKKDASESRNGRYRGGVVDSEGDFVAGFTRRDGKNINLSCIEAYGVDEVKIETRDEEVIYGGVILPYFGHLFAECLSRLWFFTLNDCMNLHTKKIVFIAPLGRDKMCEDFFRLIGIKITQIEYINRPVKYQRIYVPEQSVVAFSSYRPEYKLIYDKIKSKISKREYKKLYLARRGWKKDDVINEEFFENFYRKRGYRILSPEKLTIEEQISFLKGANEVVCTEGTLGHLALFCEENTRLTILRRAEHKDNIILQYIINQCMKLDVSYIDVSHNLLPSKHVSGVFLLGPTVYFEKYLQERGISYLPEEIFFSINEFAGLYMEKWAKKYENEHEFKEIADLDVLDILNSIRKEMGMSVMEQFNYPTKFQKIKNELKLCKKANDKLLKENNEYSKRLIDLQNDNAKLMDALHTKELLLGQLENSLSWKLTRPFRKLLFVIKNNGTEQL